MSKDQGTNFLIEKLNTKEITEEMAIKEITEYFSSMPLEIEVTKKSIDEIKIFLNTKPKLFTALLHEWFKSIEEEILAKSQDVKEAKLINLCKFIIQIFHSLYQTKHEGFYVGEEISIGYRFSDLFIKLFFLPNFTTLVNKNNTE